MKNIELKENTSLTVDIKTIILISVAVFGLATVYFALIGEIREASLNYSRIHTELKMNSEFRVKWPRGELGSLPDDAEQNSRLKYLEKHQAVLINEVDILRLKIKEFENCE
jgi:hypothetical protein